ncbi:glycosyltransferase [bacterium]|nr:glycosyltransferase [bacterium]
MKPIISVIIPMYNGERFILSAVSSVLKQTYRNFELIIVDDGSIDDSEQIVSGIRDKRISVYRKTNGGPASARNYGIVRAVGDWVAILDQDDLWYPDKLSKQMDLAKTNKYGLIFTDAIVSNMNAAKEDLQREVKLSSMYLPHCGFILRELWMQNFILSSSAMFPRKAFGSICPFREDQACFGVDDYEYWLRIARSKRVGFVDQVLVERRIHGGNYSYSNKKARVNMLRSAMKIRMNYLCKQNICSSNSISKRDLSNIYLNLVDIFIYNRQPLESIKYLYFAVSADFSNIDRCLSKISSIARRIYKRSRKSVYSV